MNALCSKCAIKQQRKVTSSSAVVSQQCRDMQQHHLQDKTVKGKVGQMAKFRKNIGTSRKEGEAQRLELLMELRQTFYSSLPE